MPSVLITGSNRGLGLEWVRQYLAAGWRVYATCRDPGEALELNQWDESFPLLSVHRLDVTRPEHITSLSKSLGDHSIDLLINNAGIYHEKFSDPGLGNLDYAQWADTFDVNTLGAVRVTEGLQEALAASDRGLVVAISSHMGSIAEIEAPGSYYYRSSKSALNAAMRGLTHALGRQGIGVLILHPGWVRTRMGGPDAPLLPEQSVANMRALVERYRPSHAGRFFRHDGSEIPW